MKLKRLHKHHTIGFDSVEKVDWHLANLWNEGFKVIRELTPKQHRSHHVKKAKRLKKAQVNRDLTTKAGVDSVKSTV